MRLKQGIAIALLAACGMAQAAVTGGSITITTKLSPAAKPVEVTASITYPTLTEAQVRVTGLTPGRSYIARAYATENRGHEFADHSWTFTPDGPEAVLSHSLSAHGAYQAGTWTYVFMVDGAKVAERSVQAIRQLPAEMQSTAPAGVPPPQLASAELTLSISRNLKAREPLSALGLSGTGVFFLVEVRGLTPGHNHQVHVEVRDGKGALVRQWDFAHVPQQPDEPIWVPVVPAAAHAPGPWTFLMQLDRRDLARVTLEARPGDHQVRIRESPLRVVWLLLVATLLVMPFVIGYQLWALRRRAVPSPVLQPVPGAAAGGLDAALLALVAANLLPLVLVAYGLSSAGELLVLYWVENLIVGFYAVLRIASARGEADLSALGRIFMIAFFLVHFGAFCWAHASALQYLVLAKSDLLPLDPHVFLDHGLRQHFPSPSPWQGLPLEFAVPIAALLVSHGVSFVHNYLQRGEVFRATAKEEMSRPYRRMIPLHIATFACGFFAISRPSAVVVLILLILIKTGGDAWLHIKSHAARSTSA